jgi:hypothetical protein
LVNIQVLALALIPLLSGGVPQSGGGVAVPLALLGLEKPVSSDYLVGDWKCSDHFFRWGITDKKRVSVRRFKGNALMRLRPDGTVRMVNLFRPNEGRWELSDQGLLIYDPDNPELGSQVLPVRKRQDGKIWLLLPFSAGATGIGLERVSEKEVALLEKKAEEEARKPFVPTLRAKRSRGRKEPKAPEKEEKEQEFYGLDPVSQARP